LTPEEADRGIHPAGIADLLPNDVAGASADLIDPGMAVMKKIREARAAI